MKRLLTALLAFATLACAGRAQTTYSSTNATSNNVAWALFTEFVGDPAPGVQVSIRCGELNHVWWYYTNVGIPGQQYHAYGPFPLTCTVTYSRNSQGQEVAQVTVPAQSPQQAGDASITLEPSSFTTTQTRYHSVVTAPSASITVQ